MTNTMGRGDVEETQLVGAGGIVGDRGFHGIAGVTQIDEVDALDHINQQPPIGYVRVM